MKLAVTFTLVTLALCCSSAAAEVCPEFLEVLRVLFNGTIPEYEAAIDIFKPTEDMKSAGIILKNLLELTPQEVKEGAARLTQKIVQSPQCA